MVEKKRPSGKPKSPSQPTAPRNPEKPKSTRAKSGAPGQPTEPAAPQPRLVKTPASRAAKAAAATKLPAPSPVQPEPAAKADTKTTQVEGGSKPGAEKRAAQGDGAKTARRTKRAAGDATSQPQPSGPSVTGEPAAAKPAAIAARAPEPAAAKPAVTKPAVPSPAVNEPIAKPTVEASSAPTPQAAPAKEPATRKPAGETAPRTAVQPAPSPSTEPPLSIVMVASEAHPFAKTGGLAEVVGSLPDALARLGHTVTIIVPRYRGVDTRGASAEPATVTIGGRTQDVTFYRVPLNSGVVAVLVDAPELFDREGLYGVANGEYGDNGWRFAVLSHAALDYIRLRGERPSIIHVHDWQTGLVPVFQKMHHSVDPIVGGVPVVFTIHNLAFQGVFPTAMLTSLGLGWEVLSLDAMEFWGQISYLKAGINFSERITTVSPTYAREILTPDGGAGFDGVLRRRAADLSGILNGIDVERWNPSADPYVPASFSAEDLSGKTQAKRALLDAVGLPTDDEAMRRPVVGLISRMTDQKGFDLMSTALDGLMAPDATWVVLGSGDAHHEDTWRGLARQYPSKVSTTIGFDERLAHLIEAGADLFLMPSRWEPCGLNQMYSLRYGTIPVVRATGGLQDTVRDPDEGGGPATGFKFANYAGSELTEALHRALEAYRNPSNWNEMQRAGMREDHSWDASAREYVKVYRTA